MSAFETHKATRQGKVQTLQRRTLRAAKLGVATNRSGHVKVVKA